MAVEFGKLDSLITDELINQCLDKHRIIIYGHAKSGKIIIARLLAERLKRKLIVTDEFMEYGFKQSMYVIKELIEETKDPLIIEGVQTPRILRKGVEQDDFYCDLVIHLECNTESIEQAYINDNEEHKLIKVHSFNQMLDNIFQEWYQLMLEHAPDKMPIIINLNTSFICQLK